MRLATGIEADHARGLRVVDAVEQQQLDPGGVPREHAEVHARAARRRPQRRAGPRGPSASDGVAPCRAASAMRRIRRAQGTGHGFAFQISAAYSAIVRSLENLPEPATFRIALRAQPSGSAYSSSSRWSASR